MKLSTYETVYYFVIKVYDKRGGLGTLIEFRQWNQLRFELRNKYDWYFKYTAALLQVKYPKYIVDVFHGQEIPNQAQTEILIRNKIVANKAKITKNKNKLILLSSEFEKYQQEYNELFDIKLNERYIQYVEQITILENTIKELESFK